MGAGKSSFINTVLSIDKGIIINKATAVGYAWTSFTTTVSLILFFKTTSTFIKNII